MELWSGRLTQQRCNAFRDGVRHTEGEQQHTNDRGGQPSHDEVQVDVSDAVSVHLQERQWRLFGLKVSSATKDRSFEVYTFFLFSLFCNWIWKAVRLTCSMTVLSHHWGPIRVMAAMIFAWRTPKAQSCKHKERTGESTGIKLGYEHLNNKNNIYFQKWLKCSLDYCRSYALITFLYIVFGFTHFNFVYAHLTFIQNKS